MRAMSILYRQGYLYLKRQIKNQPEMNGTDQGILLFLADHPGVNQDGISSHFMVNKTTVTKALDRLEKAGYILRSVRPQNRRENRIHLTPQGERVVTPVRDMLQSWQDLITSDFSKEELTVFQTLCERAADKACALNPDEPPPSRHEFIQNQKEEHEMFGSKEDKIKKLTVKKNSEKIATFINDKSESVRLAAIEGLGQIGGEHAVNALVPAMRDASTSIRAATAKALSVMKDPRTKAHLDNQLKHETDAGVKKEILHALGSIQSKD